VSAVASALAFLGPLAVLGLVASGLYTLVPGLAYPLVAAAGVALLRNRAFAASPVKFIGRDRLAGFAVFNLFFLLHTLPHLPSLHALEPERTLYVHVLSIGMYLLALTFGRLALTQAPDADAGGSFDRTRWMCSVLPLAGLSLLLASQIGQLAPAFLRETGEAADIVYILTRRPGGFFNPNMTAAIALIFLFLAVEAPAQGRPPHTPALVIVLTTFVVVLAQSRTGIIALLAYGFFALPRRSFLIVIVPMAVAAGLAFVVGLDTGRLVLQVLGRFTGDYSSQLRMELIGHGLAAFMDAPWLGKGYRFVELTTGQSTHNQVVEILACFGLVGLAVIGLASYLLYRGGSARLLLVCIAPSFLLSHNFYEAASLQAALGLALAVDRARDLSGTDEP